MIFLDAFLDVYYAYDFNHPKDRKRAYTTQPLSHSLPSVNLAHVGINLKENKLRGRIALQGGDSVKSNTTLEVNKDLGHIQEAYLGRRLSKNTWLDAGVYLGHIGMESWISRNNMTYSRSLLLDYVPYYALGLRLSHELASDLHFEAHLMNGWQNISETNSAKAFGVQIKKKIGTASFAYNNFFGDEKIFPKRKNRFRTYHNFIFDRKIYNSFNAALSLDFGTEAQREKAGINTWHGMSLIIQKKISEKNAAAFRIEHYADPTQTNVITGTDGGFVVRSTSLNFDQKFHNLLWRNEIRMFKSRDEIYPDSTGFRSTDAVFSTSISFVL